MERMHRLAGERGQSLVEFALISPILFLLLFGILDGGRVFAAWMVVTNEAREGARFVVVDTSRDGVAYVRDRTQDILDPASLDVVSTVGGSPTVVRVNLTYRMRLFTPLIARFFPDPVEVTAESVMRAE